MDLFALAHGAATGAGAHIPRATRWRFLDREGGRLLRALFGAGKEEMMRISSLGLPLGSLGVLACGALAAPFATSVVSYAEGSGAAPGYNDPTAALGSPERYTGEGVFPGAVTPFNPAWGSDEIVSIGEGGSLVVSFDAPVYDDIANPFGVDLLIFGNAFYGDLSYPNGVNGGLIGGGGIVEVSQDGTNWSLISGVSAIGNFPTLGYQDLLTAYDSSAGSVATDFLKPVDPSFDPTGLSFSQIVAGYDGSGGGTGVDLASTGLSWIQFVRVSNPIGSGGAPSIDAFARVPAPGSAIVIAGLIITGVRRRR